MKKKDSYDFCHNQILFFLKNIFRLMTFIPKYGRMSTVLY